MSTVELNVIETRIPSRLDRLPWGKFHWLVLLGLGTAWILDGLEVTIVGSVASRLTQHGSGFSITSSGIGVAAATYVAGACAGAIVFGHLTDRFGRKKLFMLTLGLYMASTAITAFSFSALFFWVFRFLTGTGIGGEYAAINSAIDELIPARARGRVDLVVNGSYWLGSIVGSALSLFFLDESIFPADLGWRLTFGTGIVLAGVVLLVRRHVPESPRWLFIHGREDEAERLVDQIEESVQAQTGQQLKPVSKSIKVRQRRTVGFADIAKTAVGTYPKRSVLCLALFVGQAFIYNGITFDLGTLMSKFFHVASGIAPVFLIIYAAANFMGPLLLGRLFDTVGRVKMISTTYLGSAALGLVLAALFDGRLLSSWTFIAIVMATFFLASAGASAAYLTSSEVFPMETRALAIAFFYAIGTAAGGITGPLLFGPLISTGSFGLVALAFVIGSALMVFGGVAELAFGVKAERAQLEDIAKPLTAEDAEGGPQARGAQAEEAEGAQAGGAQAGGAEGAQAGGAQAGGAEGAQAGQWAQAGGTGQEGSPSQVAAEMHEWRARAAEERAKAAELRALAHEQRSHAENPSLGTGAWLQERTADLSEAKALADDERALAAEELAGITDDSDSGESARYRLRAEAAEERAASHDEEAEAMWAELASTNGSRDGSAKLHREMAAAHLERARAAEQRALGREADDSEEAAMHAFYAEMHEHRARAHECRARLDAEEAFRADRLADAIAERAAALAYRIEASHQKAAADQERSERANGAARPSADEAGEANEAGDRELEAASREREEAEERVRARRARRREREVTGLRRYAPGPGRLGTHPGMTIVPPVMEEALDTEVTAIEKALEEHGPVGRDELARLVGARYWGPGAFSEALRLAVMEGGARRVSRRIYGPVDDHDGEADTPQL